MPDAPTLALVGLALSTRGGEMALRVRPVGAVGSIQWRRSPAGTKASVMVIESSKSTAGVVSMA
ncbi:hypothetical protein D3C72_783360 [compost metagenome]